jgi:energy-coupling factor transporter ATP-binding protein EcfA2
MSDFASQPDDALDRWLADQYRVLVDDLIAALDLEAGLRDAMIPARHVDLVADLSDVLDVEAGLSAIVPAIPDAAVEADFEPWRVEESTSPPGSVAVAVRRGSAARVFVSYASEDRALAGEPYRRLVADGHDVSLDRDRREGITGGEEWKQRLSERLRWADAMVCVVTSAYGASQWCMAEVGFARSQRSWLLPVWAEPGVDNPPLRSVTVTDTDLAPDSVGAALVKTLRRIDDTGGLSWPDGLSPFPGLRPFDTDQHQVFFGRTDEVKQLAGLLRSAAKRAENAALLVVGPSGCGKSSLVRAGLLPLMTYEPGWWTLPSIVPGADPVAALAHVLTIAARHIGLDWTAEHVRHQLDRGGLEELADELLLAVPGGPQRRLLLVVDQFEELLTQTAPAERAQFAGLLSTTPSGPVQVVATLRPEFFARLLGDSALATLATTIYPLRPLRREALREVIEGPARLAGIGVDDDLVARLIADTDDGEALPLLAFTLAQLADGVGYGGQLSAARYDQLGGCRVR